MVDSQVSKVDFWKADSNQNVILSNRGLRGSWWLREGWRTLLVANLKLLNLDRWIKLKQQQRLRVSRQRQKQCCGRRSKDGIQLRVLAMRLLVMGRNSIANRASLRSALFFSQDLGKRETGRTSSGLKKYWNWIRIQIRMPYLEQAVTSKAASIWAPRNLARNCREVPKEKAKSTPKLQN